MDEDLELIMKKYPGLLDILNRITIPIFTKGINRATKSGQKIHQEMENEVKEVNKFSKYYSKLNLPPERFVEFFDNVYARETIMSGYPIEMCELEKMLSKIKSQEQHNLRNQV